MVLYEGLGPNLAAIVITCGIFAFLTLGLRIYTRATKRNWGTEDSIMVAGAFPLLAMTIATGAAAFNGVGAYDSAFERPGNEGQMEKAYFWFFLFEVLYCFAIIPVKLSIAFMLNRIAANKKKFIYTNYGIMVLCVSVNLASAFYIIFQCNPVQAAWKSDLMAEGGHCQPSVYLQNVYYMCTAVNIFTDWASALMPIALLWNVQMNRNTKISVAGVLGLGLFTSVSGLIRLKYNIGLTSNVNYLHGLANIVIWGYAEPSLGMIVGNIATLRPLFLHIFRLGTDFSSGSRSHATPRAFGRSERSQIHDTFGDHELGNISSNAGRAKGDDISVLSDSASEKGILHKSRSSAGNGKGILVSKHVEISRS